MGYYYDLTGVDEYDDANPVIECWTCEDGHNVCDICDGCGERHCPDCEPCDDLEHDDRE